MSTRAISKSRHGDAAFTKSNSGMFPQAAHNKPGDRTSQTFVESQHALMNVDAIDALLAFLDTEVSSAVTELGRVVEGSRKHLQKLVYTNVVDRF
ncbi:MAG: hypothetical protein DME76_19925 [Verrucomicrobia bacterium]|nr:MAG: hypothetical protein DME76_19925 [Verrucomicrobiota bacterium]